MAAASMGAWVCIRVTEPGSVHAHKRDGWMDGCHRAIGDTVSLCFDGGRHVGRGGACVRACLRGSVGRLIIIIIIIILIILIILIITTTIIT